MDKIIILFVVLLAAFAVWIFLSDKKTKQQHSQKMMQLKDVFKNLSNQQETLAQKTYILSEYQSNYQSDVKKIGEEIFMLQQTLFESLSKR